MMHSCAAILWLLLALLASGCGAPARPRAVVIGAPDRAAYPLAPALLRVLHTDAATTAEAAARLEAAPLGGAIPAGPVWLRFDVLCRSDACSGWYLSFAPPFDEGALYVERAGRWSAAPLPAPSGALALPLPLRAPPEGPQTFLLRLDRLTTAPPILQIATARGHARAEALLLLGQGAYLGIAALVALLNAHLARRRQRAHTFYALYVLASATFFSLRLGVVPRLLDAQPRAALLLPELASLAATIALGAQFGRELLQTAAHAPRWDRVLRAYIALVLVLALLAVATPLGYGAVQAAGLALPFLSMATGLLARARGVAWARPFLLGWGALSLGALAFALPRASADGLQGVHLFQAGSALEMIFLLRALVLRLRALEDEQQARALSAARAERLATLGRLAVGVAHEVNNPNNLITFNLPVLRRYLAATEPALRARAADDADLRLLGLTVPEFLADADALIRQTELGAQRIAQIVAALKAYVRTGAPDAPRERVDLGALVERAARLLPAPLLGADLALRVDPGPGGLFTEGVPGRIEQVVTNLIVNAAEATAGRAARCIEVSARREGDRVVIEVADNGPGLSEEARAHLIEPFFTTKGRGLGLGLAISETIAREHGGAIEASPNAPSGTRFLVRLPSARIRP